MRPIVPDHAKVEIMGLPWHGRVQDDVLTPANEGPPRAYPQVSASNLLLAKTKDLPNRAGKQVDIENHYDWKDRLLLQYGTPGAAPATIASNQVVLLDESDMAWLLEISVTVQSLAYRVTVTLVSRYGLISEDPTTILNEVLLESSLIDLSSYSSTHGLYTVSGLEFVSQNPRGDEVLVGVGASYVAPVSISGVLGSIAKVTLTGTGDPETGSGISANMTTWRSPPTLVTEQVLTAEQYADVWFGLQNHVYGETVCQTPERYTDRHNMWERQEASSSQEVGATGNTVGHSEVTYTQLFAISAYYNEDGIALLVEEKHISSRIGDAVDITTRVYDGYVSEIWNPSIGWVPSSGGQYTLQGQDKRSVSRIDGYRAQLLIGGAVKSEIEVRWTLSAGFEYAIDQTGTESIPVPCIDETWDYYAAVSESTFPRQLYPDYALPSGWVVVTEPYNTNTQSLLLDGQVVWTQPDEITTIPPEFDKSTRQVSNRVFGLELLASVAATAGVTRFVGMHTDKDGKAGLVKEFGAYNPYEQAVDDDDQPIGFV